MDQGMRRREFLKFSMAAGALLAAGEATKGGLMAQETGLCSAHPLHRFRGHRGLQTGYAQRIHY